MLSSSEKFRSRLDPPKSSIETTLDPFGCARSRFKTDEMFLDHYAYVLGYHSGQPNMVSIELCSCQESNLVFDLRKLACESSTLRDQVIQQHAAPPMWYLSQSSARALADNRMVIR